MDKTICTLAMLVEGNKILLGMKKAGFGVGRFNGFGGKVVAGEIIQDAAAREMQEECGLMPTELEQVGLLTFLWVEVVPERSIEVHVFSVKKCTGVIQESLEMKPAWFKLSDIPYDRMWPDDRSWLPLCIAGKKFKGIFHFGEKEDIIYEELAVVKEL